MYERHIMEISRKKTLLNLTQQTQTQDREYRHIGNIWKIGNIVGNIGIKMNIGKMLKKGNIGTIGNIGNIM